MNQEHQELESNKIAQDIVNMGTPCVRASEIIKKCFYCDGFLPARHKEHIFNSCWGGTHKTSDLICDQCNSEFSKIDAAFAAYTRFIMNAWAIKGERHKQVLEIPLNENYVLTAGSKPKLQTPELKVLPQLDGSFKIELAACSKGEARRYLLDGQLEALLQSPLTDEERQFIWQLVSKTQLQSRDTGAVSISTNLKIQDEYRSAAHALLKCLGLFTPEVVCDERTQAIREFARYGQGSWQKFAVVVDQHFSLATDVVEQLYGVHYNASEIYWCRSLRKIIGVLTILGRIKRAVVIAEGYEGPDAILLVVEDTDGSGQLKPYFEQFDSANPGIPLLQIQFAPSTVEFFQQDCKRVVETSVGPDAFLHKLDKLSQQIDQISEQTLGEYSSSFIEFILYVAKLCAVDVDQAEVAAKLTEHGFADLAQHHIGKNYQDPAVRSILEKALTRTLDFLVSKQKK